jgi:hypothetical protein
MKKRVIWCTIGIVFGAILILGGISKMSSFSQVKCGGRVMLPGDTCESTSKYGVKKTSTYEEQAKSDQAGTWAVVGAGGLLIIFSAWKLIQGLRKRDKAAAGPDDLTQHWNQQQPPEPQPAAQGWQTRQPPPQYPQGPHQYQQPPQGWQYQQQPIPQQQPPNQSWS